MNAAPYRSCKQPIITVREGRWSVAVRTALRIVFMAIVLSTAMASGALFVAWPTQTESQSSMHTTVGARPHGVAGAHDHETASAQYVVEASP